MTPTGGETREHEE